MLVLDLIKVPSRGVAFSQDRLIKDLVAMATAAAGADVAKSSTSHMMGAAENLLSLPPSCFTTDRRIIIQGGNKARQSRKPLLLASRCRLQLTSTNSN